MIPWSLIDGALQVSDSSYRNSWLGITIEHKCGAFARVTETDHHVQLAFRGTDEAIDWGKNLRAYPWRYGDAWVHRGFMTAHQTIWSRVRNELERRGGEKPLLVTGHSYGGALAELSCLFLRDYPKPVSLVTFGKPNVFLKPRAARLQYLENQISVVCGSDLVARIPLVGYGPDLGQTMLYLATRRAEAHWIPQMTDAYQRLICDDRQLAASIDHHDIVEYRRRINQHLFPAKDART